MSDALKGPAQEQGELVSNEAKIANIIQHITDLCANNKEKLLDGLLDMVGDSGSALHIFLGRKDTLINPT